MIKKIIITGLLALIAFNMWTITMAAGPTATKPPIIPEGAESGNPLLIPKAPTGTDEAYLRGGYLPEITTTVISAAGVAAVLFIIVGGIQILTAYGSDEKIGKGKKTITFAIVGLVIAILSYAIVSVISVISL
jgi:hypothetical protein